MTKAQDRIKAAKAELEAAKIARNDERVESFARAVAKKLGRPAKRGDLFVTDHWLHCTPFRLQKLDFCVHPCIVGQWARINAPVVGKFEYMTRAAGDLDSAVQCFFRESLKTLRFARPDELNGEAYHFQIGLQPRKYDTYEDALDAIRRRCKGTPSFLTEQRGHMIAVWKKGKNIDKWLTYSAPHWWISIKRREDHPF